MVAEMVRAGVVFAASRQAPPVRHAITNVLGGPDPGVHVELHKLEVEPGDVVLLCSDGLTEMVADDRIAAILHEESEPQRAM